MGKHSAQAGNEVEAGGVRDQSRMGATRHEVWGNAREPDGGTPGRPGLGILRLTRARCVATSALQGLMPYEISGPKKAYKLRTK